MPTLTAPPERKQWAIMRSGLYAQLFRRFTNCTDLTRWVDLQEEIDSL